MTTTNADETGVQSRSSGLVLMVSLVFFGSGAAALVFENLWFRQTSLVFGNSIWASSLVMASFMGGLGLGNWLAVRRGTGITRPIRTYAKLEAAIAVVGLGLVLLFPLFTKLLVPVFRPFLDHPTILNSLRVAVAFAVLLIPTTAMGATLPILVRALTAKGLEFGPILGRLYGWNTLGAVTGALLVEFVLIGPLGIRGTAIAAAAIGAAAFFFAVWLDGRTDPIDQGAVEERVPLNSTAKRLMLASFVSGGLLLALEVVWFRLMLLFALGSSVSFALMLAVVLTGIAVGGLIASAILKRKANAFRLLPSVALLAGFASVYVYFNFDSVLGDEILEIYVGTSDLIFKLAFPLMFPVSVLSGVLFTWTGAALREHCGGSVQAAGLLTLANTFGAMLGSLLAGFVLLPQLGIEKSLFLLSLLYVVVAIATFPKEMSKPENSREILLLLPTSFFFLVATGLFPFGMMTNNYIIRSSLKYTWDGSQIQDVREGVLETMVYLKRDFYDEPASYRLVTNGFSMSRTGPADRYQKMYIYIPTALRPDPKSALQISFGVSVTARAVTENKSFETIDIVDISKDILDMSRHVYPDKPHPLDDPRVTVHIEDGRYFLQTTDQKFDIITADPPPPKVSSIVNLYTKEYFQLIYDRLNEGGVASYWLAGMELFEDDTRGILRAFCDAFEDCTLWNGSGLNWSMVGTKNLKGAPSVADFTAQWRDPVVRAEMKRLGVEKPEQIGALFIAGREWLDQELGDVPAVVDNYPHRLSPEYFGVTDHYKFYIDWMDTEDCKQRYLESSFIKEHLPPEMRTAALDYFDEQDLINDYFIETLVESHTRYSTASRVRRIHQLRSEPELSTAALWILETIPEEVRRVNELYDLGHRVPEFHWYRGLDALSKQRYAEAVEELASAQRAARVAGRDLEGDPVRKPSVLKTMYYRIYALAQLGQLDLAAKIIEQAPKHLRNDKIFFQFLEPTFGLKADGSIADWALAKSDADEIVTDLADTSADEASTGESSPPTEDAPESEADVEDAV